jgi:hypothetical protein
MRAWAQFNAFGPLRFPLLSAPGPNSFLLAHYLVLMCQATDSWDHDVRLIPSVRLRLPGEFLTAQRGGKIVKLLRSRASRESDLGRLYAHASVVMRAESSTTSERRGMGGHAELRGSAADRIRLGIRGRSLPRAGINSGPWDFCLASPSSAILKPYPSVLTPSWRIRDRIHQPGRPPWVALGALGSVSGDHRGVPDVRVAVSCVVDDRGAANCSPESLTPRIVALRRG